MKQLSSTQRALLTLVGEAMWKNNNALDDCDWQEVEKLAQEQGVLSMLYMGATTYKSIIPSERIKIWRGAMYSTVLRNEQLNEVQQELLFWMKEQGIRVAILKGTSCSYYYKQQSIRALGDIDLLVEKKDLATIDAYLINQGYKLSGREHGFHVSYKRDGIDIEVHYDVTEAPLSIEGRYIANVASNFLKDIRTITYDGHEFPALTEKNHALMLLLHMERHMTERGIGLRQLYDWAAFVYDSNPITWKNEVMQILAQCGLLTYAKALTKVCVDYLGLPLVKASWCMDIRKDVVDAIIEDVFRAGNVGAADAKGVGSIFTSRSLFGQESQTRMKGLVTRLTELSNKNFPITKKHKALLPVFWCYIPFRYWIRSIFGLRPKKDWIHVLHSSSKRQKLYEALRLYKR